MAAPRIFGEAVSPSEARCEETAGNPLTHVILFVASTEPSPQLNTHLQNEICNLIEVKKAIAERPYRPSAQALVSIPAPVRDRWRITWVEATH